jgi:hypothetical protein
MTAARNVMSVSSAPPTLVREAVTAALASAMRWAESAGLLVAVVVVVVGGEFEEDGRVVGEDEDFEDAMLSFWMA